jgi:precorrin-3B C17-methyltransferase
LEYNIYVVGIGPGGIDSMTYGAVKAIEECDLVVGYKVYVELVKEIFPQKEYFSSAMKQEKERVQYAIDAALAGKMVAVISGGDSGVYGMAGLVHEMAEKTPQLNIRVIAGVTAATSGAALLGAPLIHDFAVISLSDLLTPWEDIEKRLEFAAKGDFCICIYNPSSKKRVDYLQKACDILLQWQKEDLVCGIVRNVGRAGEEYRIVTLKELRNEAVDMFSTIFIGNSNTKVMHGKMVTPRGYRYV